MSSEERVPGVDRSYGRDEAAGPNWTNRLIVTLVVAVALVAGWFIAAAYLPTWWAQRIGDVADGGTVPAVLAGLVCGFGFAALPVLALRVVLGRRAGFAPRLVALVAGALLALPNLATLVIAVGSGAPAKSASLVLDRLAPGFAWASLVGAVLGVLAVLGLWLTLASRRRRKRQLAAARAELRRREAEDAARAAGVEDADEDADEDDEA